jgi:hypothetical protein
MSLRGQLCLLLLLVVVVVAPVVPDLHVPEAKPKPDKNCKKEMPLSPSRVGPGKLPTIYISGQVLPCNGYPTYRWGWTRIRSR